MRKKSTWRLVCALLLLIASAVVILCMIGTEQKQGLFFWVAVTLLATGALWTIGEGVLLHRPRGHHWRVNVSCIAPCAAVNVKRHFAEHRTFRHLLELVSR